MRKELFLLTLVLEASQLTACIAQSRSGNGNNGQEDGNTIHAPEITPHILEIKEPSRTPFQPLLPKGATATATSTSEPTRTLDPYPYLTKGGVNFAEGSPRIDSIFPIQGITISGTPINWDPRYTDPETDPRYGPGKENSFATATISGNLIVEDDSGYFRGDKLPAEDIRNFLEGSDYNKSFMNADERARRITEFIGSPASIVAGGVIEDYVVLDVIRIPEAEVADYEKIDLRIKDEYLAQKYPHTAKYLNDGGNKIYRVFCGWQLPDDEIPNPLPEHYNIYRATRYIVILGPKN